MGKDLLIQQIEDLKQHCRNLQANIQEALDWGSQGIAIALMDDLQEAESQIGAKKLFLEELEQKGQ